MIAFIPGRIVNPMNGTRSHAHWSVKARWAKVWRYNTMVIVIGAMLDMGWTEKPETPKRITFLGHVVRYFDDDNFRAAMKPVRDGLQDAGIIQSDGHGCGHEFVYEQMQVKERGVKIIIENRSV